MYSDNVDSVCICGDKKSHIADLKDYLNVDNISPRVVLDMGVNEHGETFIEFLKHSKCCV